jgi:hypothetical protein
MLSVFCNAICNLQFAICNLQFSIFDFYSISLLRPISTGLSNTAQNTALLSNFTMFLAYCTIACTLAMQPCPAALPGSLARQPCPTALPGSLAWQPGPAAWPGSIARQPCRKVCKLFYGRRPACMQYCILLLGRQFSSSFPRN